MSDASTRQLVSTYIERVAAPTDFYTSFSKYKSFNSEKVEIDVQRNGEDVAVVLQDITTGARINDSTIFTNKEFTPPIYKEEFVLNSHELLKRVVGATPFEDPNFATAAAAQSFLGFRKIEDKIRRAIELQWAQIYQTGQLSLVDSAGVALYTMLFQAKAGHFVGTANDWDDVSPDPLLDLENLADVIWQDGRVMPTKVVMGRSAFRVFMANAAVQARFRRDGLPLGSINAPVVRSSGNYHGWITVGQYTLEIWTNPATYNAANGTKTYYQSPWLVTMLCDGAEMVTAFGGIPRLVPPDARVASFLPGRIANPAGVMDFTTFGWVSNDGISLHLQVGARPMTIPVAIDCFGTLNAKVT